MDSRSTFPRLRLSGSAPRLFRTALLGLIALLAVVSGPLPRLNAQPPQPAGRDSAHDAAQSREAGSSEGNKSEDQTEALRHSAPVRFIARVTGLSLEHAYWLCVLINFAIVFVSVAWALRKKLPGLFQSRTETIQRGIEEARKAGEEARRRLADVEGRLSRLDVEITEMRREAEENARAEEKRILAETEEERRRIVASAEQEIALAAEAARRDLKSFAAALAVERAGEKIRVGKDADQALVREFTAQLGKDGH